MTEKKITKKENFIEIVNVLEEIGREDLAKVIKHEIELLEAKSLKAKETAAKKKVEGDALTDAVEAALTDELNIIADIANRVEFEGEVTVAKVQYRLNQLVANGKAYKEQVSVPGVDGAKARKLQAYRLPNDVEVED